MKKSVCMGLILLLIAFLTGCCSSDKTDFPGPPYKNMITPGTKLNLKETALLVIDTQNEFVCYKPRFNGFYDTSLNKFLESKKVNSVVIIGITFPNCVRATQLGATDHNYRVALVPSACTQVYPKGLEAMQGEGVQLMSLDDLNRFLGLEITSN